MTDVLLLLEYLFKAERQPFVYRYHYLRLQLAKSLA